MPDEVPDEVQAHPGYLGRAAMSCLRESIALFEVLGTARGEWPLAASSMGRSANAHTVAQAHTEVVEAAGTAVEHLIGVLEHDMEALYRTAFAYQETEQQSTEDLSRPMLPNVPL